MRILDLRAPAKDVCGERAVYVPALCELSELQLATQLVRSCTYSKSDTGEVQSQAQGSAG